jgi:nucleotide-binding universal stress UspA family protein
MINFAILPSSRGPKVYRWTDSYIQEVLNEGVSRARGLDLWDVRRVTMQANSVADGIIACADLFEADYVIIGTRGRSNFMEILSGSISRKVSAKANCPVLVVRRVRGEPTMLSKRRILERVLLSFIARVSRRDL